MILRYKSSVSFTDVIRCLFQRGNPSVPGCFSGVPTWYASASDALLDILLRSRCVGKVLLPAYTCDRVIRAILAAGCEPVFCDVDELGRMDVQTMDGVEGADLVAVVATHMFGAPLDRNFIRKFCDKSDVLFIEDCAMASYEQMLESISSPVPDACVYSFGKGKPISLGFGGMGLIKRMGVFDTRNIYSSGSYKTLSLVRGLAAIFGYTSVLWRLRIFLESRIKIFVGYKPVQVANFDGLRLTCISFEMQSQLSRLVYKALDSTNVAHLRKLTDCYREGLSCLGEPWSAVLKTDTAPFYPLVVEDRQSLYMDLLRSGINVASFYTYSAGAEYTGRNYPGSIRIAERILLLPVNDGVSEEMVKEVCRIIRQWQTVHEVASAC